MSKFLEQIANIFYSNEKANISDYAFVFPNKRAGLFFQKYLGEIVEEPMFAPHVLSINDFFLQYTQFKVEARIPLLFRLYQIFLEKKLTKDSIDLFMPFGEMLLSDFDEIAKYNVDANKLFLNISDLKEIDAHFQSDEISRIREFWEKLLPINNHKEFNRSFVELWQQLGGIYQEFNDSLRKDLVGYEGLVFGDALSNLKQQTEIGYKKVIFAGFNALNGQEHSLFELLKQKGIADFYWDSKSSFFNGMTNADHFIKHNEKLFCSYYELESKEQEKVQFEIIPISSGIGQTKQANKILCDLCANDENTVVVLPDEKLLLPMLNAIPKHIQKLNITMGFSLSLSLVHALVHSLCEMQKHARMRKDNISTFYYKHVLPVLNNLCVQQCSLEALPLVNKINESRNFWIQEDFLAKDDLLTLIFKYSKGKLIPYLLDILKQIYVSQKEVPFEKEILSAYIMMLIQLDNNIGNFNLQLDVDAVLSLIDKMVSFSLVPFNGEPLEGVQLMGFLETRLLDFDNLIILSMNDGVCPKKQNAKSIVPYNLKKFFGLPTFEQHDAISAYHFYRLLTGAKRVFLLYDDRVDNVQKSGEVSRFIYQLRYLYDTKALKLNEKSYAFDISFTKNNQGNIEITKDDFILQKIKNCKFSASALNSYIQCPLQFFLKRIVEIKEPDEISEDIGANVLGDIFHRAMQLLYEKEKDVTKENFVQIESKVNNAVNHAFSEKYLKIKDESKYEKPKGRHELVTYVIEKYIRQTLAYDKNSIENFTIKSLEKKIECKFPIFEGKEKVMLTGYIDRIHQKDGIVYIVDYKTGSDSLKCESVASLFEGGNNHPKAIFQLLMYALLLKYGDETCKNIDLQPNIYLIKKILSSDFSPQIKFKVEGVLEKYNDVAEEYEAGFRTLLEEIFNKDIPFKQNPSKACEYCPFKIICGN